MHSYKKFKVQFLFIFSRSNNSIEKRYTQVYTYGKIYINFLCSHLFQVFSDACYSDLDYFCQPRKVLLSASIVFRFPQKQLTGDAIVLSRHVMNATGNFIRLETNKRAMHHNVKLVKKRENEKCLFDYLINSLEWESSTESIEKAIPVRIGTC